MILLLLAVSLVVGGGILVRRGLTILTLRLVKYQKIHEHAGPSGSQMYQSRNSGGGMLDHSRACWEVCWSSHQGYRTYEYFKAMSVCRSGV